MQPVLHGGELVGMLGDSVLIYDLGDKVKDFDPNIDPQDARVFIDFVFKIDPNTKEEKGLYYINYYYSLKPEEKEKITFLKLTDITCYKFYGKLFFYDIQKK